MGDEIDHVDVMLMRRHDLREVNIAVHVLIIVEN